MLKYFPAYPEFVDGRKLFNICCTLPSEKLLYPTLKIWINENLCQVSNIDDFLLGLGFQKFNIILNSCDQTPVNTTIIEFKEDENIRWDEDIKKYSIDYLYKEFMIIDVKI